MTVVVVPFACPACTASLPSARDVLTCTGCQAVYAVHDGVHDLRGSDAAKLEDASPVDADSLRRVIAGAGERTWDETLQDLVALGSRSPGWRAGLLGEGQYAWKLFLDLPPGSRVLDLTRSLGNFAVQVAPQVGAVVVADTSLEQLALSRMRLAAMPGVAPVAFVAMPPGPHLPFPPATFDCVVLDNCLPGSWHGAAGRGTAHVHARFLADVRRVLVPEGQVFLSVTNRWSRGSLRRMTSLRNRPPETAQAGRDYPNVSYSAAATRRLLRSAGFSPPHLLQLSPSTRVLRTITPPATASFWQPRRPRRLSERLKGNAALADAFGAVAGVAPRPWRPLLERVIEHAGKTTPALAGARIESFRVTGKDKVVCMGRTEGTTFVLKLPADARGLRGEIANRLMLDRIASHPETTSLVPRPLAHGEVQGVHYFVEEALTGRSLGAVGRSIPRERQAEQVWTLLLRLQGCATDAAVGEGGERLSTLLISEPVERLHAAGIGPALTEPLVTGLRQALDAAMLPVGFAHGDFSQNNIFVRGSAVAGVIDLEYAVADGLPILDLLTYLDSAQRFETRRTGGKPSVTDNFVRLARWDWPAAEVALLRTAYATFGLDAALHQVMSALAWLQHVSRQAETINRYRKTFRRQVESGLVALARVVAGPHKAGSR